MSIAETARRIWSEWCDWLARKRKARIARRTTEVRAARDAIGVAIVRARIGHRNCTDLRRERIRLTNVQLRMELRQP